MRCWWLAAAFSVLASVAAHAVTYSDFVGTWAVRVADKNLFILVLQPDGDGLGGYLNFPRAMRMGKTNFEVADPHVGQEEIVGVQITADMLVMTMRAPGSKAVVDHYIMRFQGRTAVLARGSSASDFDAVSRDLVRVEKDAQLATDWELNYEYAFDGSNAPNAEIKTLFSEDQRVRKDNVDSGVMMQGDADRRARARQLLAQGLLHSGKDFEDASFIFQHGDTADDFLLAHTLATVAVAKGDKEAIWISAATLDRYLIRIGQKQIYGTQYNKRGTEAWTQEPYDQNLVSDALRTALGVPPQTEQQKQLNGMNAGTPGSNSSTR